MEICCMAQKTQTGSLYQPRRTGGEGDGREVQKEGYIYIYIYIHTHIHTYIYTYTYG